MVALQCLCLRDSLLGPPSMQGQEWVLLPIDLPVGVLDCEQAHGLEGAGSPSMGGGAEGWRAAALKAGVSLLG